MENAAQIEQFKAGLPGLAWDVLSIFASGDGPREANQIETKLMTAINNITIGTISHGTLRPQDLIPAFLDAVQEYAPAHYEGLMAAAFGPIPAYVMDEGDDSDWWNSEDAGFLLDDLFNILDEAAPEGVYFGAHPGDGSDFGFWEVIED